MEPETDNKLSADDRRKARDIARELLKHMHAVVMARPQDLDPAAVRDYAAAIRDLDAVSRGPIP